MPFGSESLGVSEASVRLLRDLVHERLGLHYDGHRLEHFADRLAPLVVQRGFGSMLDYYYLLKYDPAGEAEWSRVMDALAVSETYFWREIDQLRAVVGEIVPRLLERTPVEPLQIWSVPCATGEDPLTLAMLLDEQGSFSRAPIRIIGSDASPAAVDKARRGVFRERSFRALPPAYRDRYFEDTGDGWRIDRGLLGRVTWDVTNLLLPSDVARWGRSPVVLCRNVFIYFSPQSITRAVQLLAEQMPTPGYLCVGSAESLLRVTDQFVLEEIAGAFIYTRSAGQNPGATTMTPQRKEAATTWTR
jgi:chemotaxis protein methyltransferase CheR